MQTGTLILEGLEQGGRDALMTLWVIASAGVSALIIGFLIAAWLICRNDAKRRKAERERRRVRTYLEIDGIPHEFEVREMKEAA